MTKIIAAILAVLMLVTCFAACGEKKPPETTPNNNSGIPDPDHKDPATDPNNKPENPSDTDPNNKPDNPDEIVFDDVDETVYVTADTLTLRTSTNFDSTDNVKAYAKNGTAVKRTGYHKEWSRIEWEGEVVYCATKYLSTVNPNPEITITFTEVDETVYVDTTPNKHPDGTIPSHGTYYLFPIQIEEYIAGYLAFGAEVKRTGIYYVPAEEDPENEGLGWSRIEIDGETYYIRNSNVSITKPAGAGDGMGADFPEGYTGYSNGDVFFIHPESWTVQNGTPVIIIDTANGNNITVTSSAKDDSWATMTADIYTEAMTEVMAAQGITLSDVTVEQLTTENGEKVTKIVQTAKTATVPAGMLQTLFIINAGELDYVITVTEATAAEGLVDAVFGSLKSVK